jgi:NodT family efflux transporter outer membrane factor (OMF) lipoprotein
LRRLPLLLSLLLASGCAVGPDFERPAPPSSAASYAAKGESLPAQAALGQTIAGGWWRIFKSAALDAVMDEALRQNRDWQAAQARLAEVQEQVRAAGGVLYPQLAARAGATREKVDFTSYGLIFPSNTLNLYSVGATVSYALDIFGHDRRLVEGVEAEGEAAAYRLQGAYLTLTGMVATQALALASLDAQIALVEQAIAADGQRLELMRAARHAGTLSDREIAEMEGQAAADGALLPPLRSARANLRHMLALLVGKTPAEWSPPSFDLAGFALPEKIPLSLPSELVRRRPDILAAEAELHAASAAVGLAEANRFPRLVLTADITQWAKFPGQLWRDAATGAGVSGGLTAPLFEGGRLAAESRAAEQSYRASLARYQQTVLQSFAQVATLLQSLTQDDEARRQTGLAAKAAADSARFAEMRRDQGVLGMLPLLAARRQENLAKLAEIQSRTRSLSDSAELLLAMGGGGWEQAGASPQANKDE